MVSQTPRRTPVASGPGISVQRPPVTLRRRWLLCTSALAMALLVAGCGAAGTGTKGASQAGATASPTLPKAPLTTPATYTITDVSTLQISGTTVPGASVELLDGSGNAVTTAVANASGAFVLDVSGIQYGGNGYYVQINAPGYAQTTGTVSVTREMSKAAAAASAAAAARASSAAAAAAAAAAKAAADAAAAVIASYKASAAALPYNQLVKDPTALAGKVVTYKAQVFQYDTNTGTSNFIASVTDEGYNIWTNNIWADVDPSIATHVCNDTIIRFWGEVVGPYTYTTTLNGSITIPEINIKYLSVVSKAC